jgi:hypothetical protein
VSNSMNSNQRENMNIWDGPPDKNGFVWMDKSEFADKIGLSTKNRKPRLERTLERARKWYQANGGDLVWTRKGNKIGFKATLPRIEEDDGPQAA